MIDRVIAMMIKARVGLAHDVLNNAGRIKEVKGLLRQRALIQIEALNSLRQIEAANSGVAPVDSVPGDIDGLAADGTPADPAILDEQWEVKYKGEIDTWLQDLDTKFWARSMYRVNDVNLRVFAHPLNTIKESDIVEAYTRGMISDDEIPFENWFSLYQSNVTKAPDVYNCDMTQMVLMNTPKVAIDMWLPNPTPLAVEGQFLWDIPSNRRPRQVNALGMGLRFDISRDPSLTMNQGEVGGYYSQVVNSDYFNGPDTSVRQSPFIGESSPWIGRETPRANVYLEPYFINPQHIGSMNRILSLQGDSRPTVMALGDGFGGPTARPLYALILPDSFARTKSRSFFTRYYDYEPVDENASLKGGAPMLPGLEQFLNSNEFFRQTSVTEIGVMETMPQQLFGF
jgi:hypothetical protein